MNISMEDKKNEAIERMKKLKIFPETRMQFERDDLISESSGPMGACYWLDDEQLARVRKFEEENNALVYHVIHSYTNIGELENYLFVGDNSEEWGMDREDIKNDSVFAYVFNKDMPDCSEFGTIGIQLTIAAGLRRTW